MIKVCNVGRPTVEEAVGETTEVVVEDADADVGIVYPPWE